MGKAQLMGTKTETRSASALSGNEIAEQKAKQDLEPEQDHASSKGNRKDRHQDPAADEEKGPDAKADGEGEGEGEDEIVDPNVVTWDGPDDPANPRNWSQRRKMLNVSLVSLSVLYSYV